MTVYLLITQTNGTAVLATPRTVLLLASVSTHPSLSGSRSTAPLLIASVSNTPSLSGSRSTAPTLQASRSNAPTLSASE